VPRQVFSTSTERPAVRSLAWMAPRYAQRVMVPRGF
jgi:hypothetical protein